jgi:hypothetical protein
MQMLLLPKAYSIDWYEFNEFNHYLVSNNLKSVVRIAVFLLIDTGAPWKRKKTNIRISIFFKTDQDYNVYDNLISVSVMEA